MAEDEYADAIIYLEGILEKIKDEGILTKEDVLREVDNAFDE